MFSFKFTTQSQIYTAVKGQVLDYCWISPAMCWNEEFREEFRKIMSYLCSVLNHNLDQQTETNSEEEEEWYNNIKLHFHNPISTKIHN